MAEKIVLIDGHSILNRAFFGIPDLTNSEGLHTNAIYGFLNIMLKILDEEKPEYLTVAFDVHAPTFRHEMYADYKGTRKPMAEELRQQVPSSPVCLLIRLWASGSLKKPGWRRTISLAPCPEGARRRGWKSLSSAETGIFCSLPRTM